MSLEKKPDSMVIIGAGAIGIEFAHFYSQLGTEITIIEMLDTILPIEDVLLALLIDELPRNRTVPPDTVKVPIAGEACWAFSKAPLPDAVNVPPEIVTLPTEDVPFEL